MYIISISIYAQFKPDWRREDYGTCYKQRGF